MENQNSILKANMAKKTSDELLAILKHSSYEIWSFESFKVANEILDEREVEVPVELKVGQKPKDVLQENEKNWFIEIEEGNLRYNYNIKEIKTKLPSNILEGKYSKTSKVIIHHKKKGDKWDMEETTLFKFSKDHFRLRVIYQPVWAHAMEGLAWGIKIGIGLKLLDTLIALAYLDIAVAVLFLAAIIILTIPRIGFIGIIALVLLSIKYTGLNLFGMVFVASLTGAILGSLPGMAIGGIIGFFRNDSQPNIAKDAIPESKSLVYKAIYLPLIGGIALFLLYIYVVNPWIMSVLE